MSNFVPSKQHLREVLIHYFHLKKSATEAQRLLIEAYPEYSVSIRMCQEWFVRFRSGDFDTEDKERPGPSKKFEDDELEALLDEDPCQTQEELAKSLGVTHSAISKRLKAAGYIQKQGNWVPYELKPRDVERRFCMSEMLLQRHKKKAFLHRMVTGDEKWIHYDNPKRKKSYTKRGKPAKSTPKPNIHGAKVMLCIWWDQKGVLYYELLKPGETINGDRYRQQLIKLNAAIKQKRPEYATRHESIIFHHDNARPHVAVPVKNYLENVGWEILPYPPYSPDLAPSDYHLFRSMQNHRSGIRFTSVEGIKKWLDSFFALKNEQFFWDGIHKLPERWEKVVASDGQYFE
jgi:[histone H3]-lysine36 N-dimethyltransferase SETMAR